MIKSDAHVSGRITGIDRDGPLETRERLCHTSGVEAGKRVAPLEDRLVGGEMRRGRLHKRPSGKSDLQLDCNGVRDLILDLEDVGEVPVVALRPELRSIVGRHQMRGYANPVAHDTNAALEDVIQGLWRCLAHLEPDV